MINPYGFFHRHQPCHHSNNYHAEKKKNASEENTYLEGERTKKKKKQQRMKRNNNHERRTWRKHKWRKKMHACKEEEAPTRRRRPMKHEQEVGSRRGSGRLKQHRWIVARKDESLFAFYRDRVKGILALSSELWVSQQKLWVPTATPKT